MQEVDCLVQITLARVCLSRFGRLIISISISTISSTISSIIISRNIIYIYYSYYSYS